MPIVVTLLLMSGYVVLGAALFKALDPEWQLIDAIYFSWITLSTIGLGDFVPGSRDGSNKLVKLTFTTAYCFVGLALISMGISLMQEQLVAKARWTQDKMGLRGGGQAASSDKYILTKHFDVLETPIYGAKRPETLVPRLRQVAFNRMSAVTVTEYVCI